MGGAYFSYEFVGGPADGHVQVMNKQPTSFLFRHAEMVSVMEDEYEDTSGEWRHVYVLSADDERLYYQYRGLE